MAISSSVQFSGIENVVRAYEMREIPRWAMFNNRQFLFKYEGETVEEGATLLREILDALISSPAVYTLKVYEDPTGGKIKEKTDCDGSFNFRLSDNVGAVGGVSAGGINYELAAMLKEMRQEQKQLQERIEMMEGDDTELDNDAVSKTVGQINSILTIPGVSELVGAVISRFVNPVSLQRGAGIAGVADNENQSADETARRVLSAYNIINNSMPEALDLLEKLAMMAQSEPGKFQKFKMSIGLFL